MTIARRSGAFRLALTSLGFVALAACQTSSPYADGDPGTEGPRPNFPTRVENGATGGYTADTQVLPPAQQPVNPAPAYEPPPPLNASPGVDRQPLPPLQAEPAQPPVVAQPPYTPPPPYEPTYRAIADGPVVDAEGPGRTHTVRSGQTLTQIARELDTTVAFLVERNNISNPSNIRPGQRIMGPGGQTKAYVVQSGDTLSAIGRRFNVSAAQIAAANDMNVNGVIRPNQRLVLPSGYRDTGPGRIEIASAPSAAPYTPPPVLRPTTPSASLPPPPPPPPPVAARPVIPPPPPVASSAVTDLRTLGQGRFIWPLRGRLLGGFGSRGVGQQSNGLSISASPGTDVRASAEGTVIYAGNEVADFGNLVLIQHDSGFVTTYAHLSRIDVRNNQRITQNQVLGQVGQTGAVTEPQLYFEMRHQSSTQDLARPFDPTILLPPQG